ncbi:MAG TPA: carbon monoxide dehydrogenase subunit G [Candidatus Limnocylindrales bacterium]|nr:carbon monoxide dehydrogenase subunit G [Candidatus Limnocylindrales bacterium]
MDFAGRVSIAATRQAVWDFLTDFEALPTCGPGVESVEPLSDGRARIHARLGFGFIVARFTIDLESVAVEPPDHATIRGSGEAPGSQVEGRAEMRLSGPPAGPTEIDWNAEVELFGSLAGAGARLVESAAGRLIDQAFDCVRSRLEATAA